MERYRHFKGGLYQVLVLAEQEDTGEQLVIYQALYGENKVYARSLVSFLSEVDRAKYPDAVQRYRFEKVTATDSDPAQEEGSLQEEESLPTDLQEDRKGEKTAEAIAEKMTAGAEKATEALLETAECGMEASGQRSEYAEAAAAESRVEPEKEAEPNTEEERLDPMLERFLDARTIEDKLTILDEMRGHVTDAMIDTMAIACDVEVDQGPIQVRYEDLHDCLLTIRRYELERGRLRG